MADTEPADKDKGQSEASSLPVVNAIQDQTGSDVQNRQTLQNSFRGSLGALGTKINSQTSVLSSIADTMEAAYNIDQQQLLADAENNLEQTRRDQAEADEKAKEGKLATKIKGGFLDILKKAFLGAGIFTVVNLVVKYWDDIKVGFEKLKPALEFIKDSIFSLGVFIFENFETIATAIGAIWIGLKVYKGIKLLMDAITAMKAGFVLMKSSVLTTATSLKSGAISLKSSAGRLATRVKGFVIAMASTAVSLAKSGAALARSAGGKLVKIARVVATSVMALGPMLMGVGASLGPVLVAAAPIIAIGAAIALVMYGLYEAFNEMQAVFEDTGSVGLAVTEGLSKLHATIVGFVPDLLKSAVSWVARKLGFDEAADALDSFSITDFIQNGIATIFDNMRIIFMKAINGVIGIVNAALDWIPGFGAETIKPAFDIEKEEALIDEKNKKKEERQAEKLKGKEEEAESEPERPNAKPLSQLAEDRLNAKQQLQEQDDLAGRPDILDQMAEMQAAEHDALRELSDKKFDEYSDVMGSEQDITDVMGSGDDVADIMGSGDDVRDIMGSGDDVSDILGSGDDVADIMGSGDDVADIMGSGDDVRDILQGKGSESGGIVGSQINAQSSEAAAGASNVVVTTVAPTNISAPTSTSVNSQTMVPPSAVKGNRRRSSGRQPMSYA